MFVDVIELSSDEDEVVCVEKKELIKEEEESSEEEEDEENSGGHANDEMNQPDEDGQVLVNVGHPSEDPDIFLAPQLSATVKPHQVSLDLEFCSVSHFLPYKANS